MPYPRLSIVTPSYNQADYLERTITSVLDQQYTNFEYIIMDGGSTDQSVDIIKKYERHLTFWRSERDGGQAEAINKGFTHASGDIYAYINSDDYYLPGAFKRVAHEFTKYCDADIIHGACIIVDSQGNPIRRHIGDIKDYAECVDLWSVWWKERQWIQPEVFWTRQLFERVGPFREDLNIAFDFEYWTRALRLGAIVLRDDFDYAAFRVQSQQKTSNHQAVAEDLLQVVGSQIYDWTVPIPLARRLALQGQWAYQVKLLKGIDESTLTAEPKRVRWAGILRIVCMYPEILLTPELYKRLRIILKGR